MKFWKFWTYKNDLPPWRGVYEGGGSEQASWRRWCLNSWHDEIRMGEREVGDWRDKHQECLWYGKVRDVCKEQTV